MSATEEEACSTKRRAEAAKTKKNITEKAGRGVRVTSKLKKKDAKEKKENKVKKAQ